MVMMRVEEPKLIYLNEEGNGLGANDSIKTYINHFAKHLSKIKLIENPLYKKILYFSVLDALARAYSPHISSPKTRMLKLVLDLSSWMDKDRVSVIQLKLNLEHSLPENDLVQSNLYLMVQRKISKWASGNVYYSSEDCSARECLNMAKKNEEKALNHAKYIELFYTYRNRLIHEFREPGYGIELDDDGSNAYYHSIMGKTWQLVFPMDLFETISLSCLSNLSMYFEQNNLNPSDNYEFGDMWTEGKKFTIS